MNYLPISSINRLFRQRRVGFTLVEIMTALTVLSIMLLMMGQLLAFVSQAWINGHRNVNDFTKSRAMLDMFASDIQAGIFRSDVTIFPNSNLEFYTKRAGIPSASTSGTVRNASLVQYSYNTDTSTSVSISTFERGDMAILWSSSASQISFGSINPASFGSNTTTPRNTAPGVIAYKVLFVYSDGTSSTTYPSTSSNSPSLCAVALTLAVVDDQSLQQLSPAQVLALRSTLDGAVSGTRSVKADWEAYLNGSAMSWTSYPKTMASGLKVFERYVTITGL